MSWSTTAPSAAGWYWFRSSETKCLRVLELAEVTAPEFDSIRTLGSALGEWWSEQIVQPHAGEGAVVRSRSTGARRDLPVELAPEPTLPTYVQSGGTRKASMPRQPATSGEPSLVALLQLRATLERRLQRTLERIAATDRLIEKSNVHLVQDRRLTMESRSRLRNTARLMNGSRARVMHR
jgi:hypothetical protein